VQTDAPINNSCSIKKTEKASLKSTASSALPVVSSKDIFEGNLIEIEINIPNIN
jgi:hypothetical protein